MTDGNEESIIELNNRILEGKEKETKEEETREEDKKEEEKKKEEEEEVDIDDGTSYLTSKKREELSLVFDRLKKELDEKKCSLKKIYEKYIPEIKDFQKKKIDKSFKNSIQLYFSFYIFGPLFSIFNLIGIYQSIGIMKTLFEEIKQQIWILIKNKYHI